MFCTHCGTQIADGSKFCYMCGAQMKSAEPVVEAVEEAPVAEQVIEQVAEPVVEAVEEAPVVEQVIEQVAEPVAEQVIEQVAEPVVEAVEEAPVVEQVIEQVAEPVVEAVEEAPVVEQVIEQVAEPVVEAVEEIPVVDAVVEQPIVEAIVDEPIVQNIDDMEPVKNAFGELDDEATIAFNGFGGFNGGNAGNEVPVNSFEQAPADNFAQAPTVEQAFEQAFDQAPAAEQNPVNNFEQTPAAPAVENLDDGQGFVSSYVPESSVENEPVKKKKKGLPAGAIIGIIIGILVVLGGIGVGGYFAYNAFIGGDDKPSVADNTDPDGDDTDPADPDNTDPVDPNGGDTDPVDPVDPDNTDPVDPNGGDTEIKEEYSYVDYNCTGNVDVIGNIEGAVVEQSFVIREDCELYGICVDVATFTVVDYDATVQYSLADELGNVVAQGTCSVVLNDGVYNEIVFEDTIVVTQGQKFVLSVTYDNSEDLPLTLWATIDGSFTDGVLLIDGLEIENSDLMIKIMVKNN